MSPTELFVVRFSSSATRDFAKLDRGVQERVDELLRKLAVDPRADARKLRGQAAQRLRVRVGDWRVVYSVDDGARRVDVLRVGHRSEVYE